MTAPETPDITTEAMSDKQLERLAGLAELPCSCDNADCQNFMSALTSHQAQDLVAEAKRARAEVAELRARLPEPGVEWGIWWPGSNLTEPVRDEETARSWAAEYTRLVAGGAPELVPIIKVRDALVREAGPWREVRGACLCPHDLMPDGQLVPDGVMAAGCPLHDAEEGGNRG